MRRVPVILQMTQHECGAACLAMVLTYYGRDTSVTECRRYLKSGRDGLTARSIAQAGRELGLRVRAFSLEPSSMGQVRLPAIVHWQFMHFLVVERWTDKAVHVVDPAAGRRKLTHEEFNEGFTGVVLTMEPGADFQRKKGQEKYTWRNYLQMLLVTPGAGKLLGQVLTASAALQILGLVFPLFTMVLVDQILPSQDVHMLTMLGMGMVSLVMASVVLGYLRSTLALYMEARLDSEVMLGFFEHVLRLPYNFFQERNSGDILARLGSIAVIRQVLTGELVSILLDGSMAIFYAAVLFVWQPFFGFLALIVGVLQVLILLVSRRPLYELTERDIAAQAESQSYLVEALTGIGTLKSSGSEDSALSHWTNLFYKQLNVSLKRNHVANVVETARDLIGSMTPIVLLWVGALFVLNGSLTLGTMLAVTTLAGAFVGPLTALVGSAQQIQLIGVHLARMSDVMETPPEQQAAQTETISRLKGKISIRNAGFRYHENGPWILRNLSLEIEPGQKVGIVGRTGSGKSTLALLLLGLYQLDEGEILYDGKPLTEIDHRSLRTQVGMVMQDPVLFSGSVRNNIASFDRQLPLLKIESAAILAQVHDEIMRMPMGYDTVLAEGGVDLAGGQRQRLALARALAHRPSILILDEATSNLDAETEAMVEENLSVIPCTRVVIAHRLSTVRNADKILVLDQGVIVEQGAHEELLALGGAYANLIHLQYSAQGWDVPVHSHLPASAVS
ncbi:MAG: peptidase domain-containing ABC transporter [Caldilineaceae bacterium]